MSGLIGVTGGTGRTGRLVTQQLVERGAEVTILSRTASTNPEYRTFDWNVPETYAAAFVDVAVLFVSTPFSIPVSSVAAVVDAAVAAGVRRIVQLSALDAAGMPSLPLRAVERVIERAPVETLVVEANWFMQNFIHEPLRTWIASGTLYGCAGEGRASIVDASDVADVCAAALLGASANGGGRLAVTGSTALSMADVAAVISRAVMHPVAYIDETPDAFGARLATADVPPPAVPILVDLFRHFGAPPSALVTDAIGVTTGYRPRTMSDFATEHADAWQTRDTADARKAH